MRRLPASDSRARFPMRCAALVVLVLVASPGTRALEEQDCHDGHSAMLRSLAENREQRLRHVRDALESGVTAHEAERLRDEGEQAWDHEEQMRGVADQDRRDCLRHARETADVPR